MFHSASTNMPIIPYSRQSISEEDIAAVTSVLRSDWLTQGPKIREFEEALSAQCGARHCVLVSNGTLALHLACLALEVGDGDTGVTAPISFMASANCIAYCGGKPDFADIDRDTLCLSPDKVEEFCETHGAPAVVIPVDFAGVPADLPRFSRLAERYGFRLIEDAAHAIGSIYLHKGREYACGSCAHTDLAIFSFHPVKSITTGEGGAVLTNDDGLAEKLRRLVNHGVVRDPSRFHFRESGDPKQESMPGWYHEMHDLGFNGRITDIQCALGLSQLKRLKKFKDRRQEIVKAYQQSLKELERREVVLLPPWPEGTDPCYHLYPLRVGRNSRVHRDDLYRRLREKGIHCQIHYIPIYRQPYYQHRYHYAQERFPESERFFSSCISLPLYPEMSDSEFNYIIDAIFCMV